MPGRLHESPEAEENCCELFVSRRERRLWVWTMIIVAGIYSTLGVTPKLVPLVSHPVVSGILFAGCLLLTGMMILTQGLQVRPHKLEIGVGLGVLAVYLLLLVRLTLPERSHLMEYGIVAVFLYEALIERKRAGRRVPFPALLAIAGTWMLGTCDELIQAILPTRVFEWQDILFNLLAGLLATTAMVILHRVRKRVS